MDARKLKKLVDTSIFYMFLIVMDVTDCIYRAFASFLCRIQHLDGRILNRKQKISVLALEKLGGIGTYNSSFRSLCVPVVEHSKVKYII